MFSFFVGLFCVALSASLSASAHAQMPDPVSLVQRADEYRQIYKDAVMEVHLTRMIGQQKEGESRLKVAVRGASASLIQVMQGADAGQQVLMIDEGLWVKLPRSTRNVRITPLQRMLGDAAVGDIGRMRWQDDYGAQFADPAEGVVDGVAVWRLELNARSPLATYTRIVAGIAKSDARPLVAEFFLKSGKPVKAVRFGPLESINDRKGIRRMDFQDLIKQDHHTELAIERITPTTLEPRWFTLEALGQWN